MKERSAAFTLVELLVVIAIIAMLIAILIPAVQSARGSARRTECSNNLRQIGIALNSYHARFSQFPPGTNVSKSGHGLSWNVHLLPFLDFAEMYDAIDPSAGPSGKQERESWVFARREIDLFTCPSHSNADRNRSNYSGVMGSGKTLTTTEDQKHCGSLFTDGVLHPNSSVTTAHIKDGVSNTMIIGERSYLPDRTSWMHGSRPTVSLTKKMCVLSAKNIVWPINSQGTQSGFSITDRNADETLRKVLVNDLMFGSEHPSGAYFLFVDGGVHFLDEAMDFTIYQDMATIDGGELTTIPK